MGEPCPFQDNKKCNSGCILYDGTSCSFKNISHNLRFILQELKDIKTGVQNLKR